MNIRFGALVADARGSTGGLCVTRSAAGSIARTRIKCVNPRSDLQRARRAGLSQWAERWSGTVTEAQRTAWRDWAANSPGTNKLGDTITLSGFNCYARLNTLRALAELAAQDAAPTAYGTAGSPAFTVEPTTDNNYRIGEPGSPWDSSADNTHIIFFESYPQGPGRIATPNRFAILTFVAGDSVAPPGWPATPSSAYILPLDHHSFIKGVYLDEDGRVGSPYVAHGIVVAP